MRHPKFKFQVKAKTKTKAEPSTADMTAKLRRVIIAAKYQPAHPGEPTAAEIHAVRLAWEGLAA